MTTDARRVAADALVRIEGGAYANLVLPGLLDRSGLRSQDKRFATELVYGTTRMRRACDWLVDRFLMHPPDATARAVLRLGAYQLAFLGTPAHAAVSATVAVAPGRVRGMVNAVLRRVATSLPVEWPDTGTRLSYPDWVVDRVVADLGSTDGLAALEAMNTAAAVTTRADGYTQDLASQWVVAALGDVTGMRIADLCAGPGGKATALVASGGLVVAADARPARAGLVVENARGLRQRLPVVAADGRAPAWRPGSFDVVLVDAPCSGLGVFRRRPDARWRIQPDDVKVLVGLQQDLLLAASALVAPGGLLAYSVCTLTSAETTGIDAWASRELPAFSARPADGPWRAAGRGARLLPQDHGTDGMYLLLLRSTPRS